MNLIISGHQLDVTPSLREYVLTKLGRVTRHCGEIIKIVVLMTVENLREIDGRQKVKVSLHLKRRNIIVEEAHRDMYAAIDLLMDKLDKTVLKRKRQQQNPGRCTGRCGSAHYLPDTAADQSDVVNH
jgi:putative sigma-54 modulation protein